MKKLTLLIFFSFLMLWLLTSCRVTAGQESASVPPAQSDGPGAVTAEPPSSEAVLNTPDPTETVPATTAPPENTPDISAPPENTPDTSASLEVGSGEHPPDKNSAVTLIYQNPELPNGCEITSLAILLDWAGYPIDKVELSNTYLPKQGFYRSDEVLHGADPNRAYAGDPSDRSSGWYCFEGPILEAANAYLAGQNTTQRAAPLSGTTREELENYMNDGIPLAVWVTLDYSEPWTRESSSWILPDGAEYVPYTNLLCVVLAGWDGDDYRIANPIDGWQTVSPDRFWNCFDAMGRRAVAILPN